MAGRKAADDDVAADAPDVELNLERVAVGPALTVSAYSAAIAKAMAVAADNATALQQQTMDLALAATARSVRLVEDLQTPGGPDDLQVHHAKEP